MKLQTRSSRLNNWRGICMIDPFSNLRDIFELGDFVFCPLCDLEARLPLLVTLYIYLDFQDLWYKHIVQYYECGIRTKLRFRPRSQWNIFIWIYTSATFCFLDVRPSRHTLVIRERTVWCLISLSLLHLMWTDIPLSKMLIGVARWIRMLYSEKASICSMNKHSIGMSASKHKTMKQ